MPLTSGTKLGPYEIQSQLGAGGMGIVYKALDLKLNREVALKVLPPELVSDPDRKRRFVQEAQAAAALKHPNIATMRWLKFRAQLRSRPAFSEGRSLCP